MDVKLELLFRDEAVYLNFWHPENGNSLLCQIRNEKLFRFLYSTEECEAMELDEIDFDPYLQEEIDIVEFVGRIRKAMNVDEEQRKFNDEIAKRREDFKQRYCDPEARREFEARMKEAWDKATEEEGAIWRDPEEEDE